MLDKAKIPDLTDAQRDEILSEAVRNAGHIMLLGFQLASVPNYITGGFLDGENQPWEISFGRKGFKVPTPAESAAASIGGGGREFPQAICELSNQAALYREDGETAFADELDAAAKYLHAATPTMKDPKEYVKAAYAQVWGPTTTPGELALRAVELALKDAASPSPTGVQAGQAQGWRTGLPDDNEKYWVLVKKQDGRLKVKRSKLTPAKNAFYVKYDKLGNAPIEEVIGWQPIIEARIPHAPVDAAR